MPQITISNRVFTETSEQPGKVVYSDTKTVNTEPFLIEIRNDVGKARNSARTSTVTVRTIVPYSDSPAMTEVISASFTLRYQPSVLYANKSAKIDSVMTVLAKLMGNAPLKELLLAGGSDASGITIN